MQIEPSDHPHLLEWHSANCLALAELSASPRAKKLLRLLAADLALEADALWRHAKARQLELAADRYRERCSACGEAAAHERPVALPGDPSCRAGYLSRLSMP